MEVSVEVLDCVDRQTGTVLGSLVRTAATYVGVGRVEVKKYMTVPAKPSAPRASAMTGARLGAGSLMVV